jgi:tetratricopeptide (TPR) repeat protein/predicted flap endonuclease-1-like 5' DNA nuclease
VLKLADALDGEGRLTVLLAARADRRDRLPGDLDDPTGLWGGFETLELGELSDLAFGDMLGAVYDHYGIEEEGTSPTTEIGRRMGAQTPLGVLSATRAVVSDIEDPEPGGPQDWAYAYERLEDSPRRRSVLEAVRMLHDLRVAPTVRLVEGLFAEVFGHDGLRDRLDPHVEALERDGWFERVEAPTSGAGPHGYELVPAVDGEKLLVAPPVAYEAVPSRTDDAVDELAAFLGGAVEDYVAADATATLSVDRRWRWRPELRYPVAVHLRLIEYLADGPPRKRVDPGIERLQGPLGDDEGNGFQLAPNGERIETYLRPWGDRSPPGDMLDDAFGAMLERTDRPAALRALYARYLLAAGRTGDAAAELETALEAGAPPVAEGYAGVLALARGDSGAAVKHLAAVHEAWEPGEPGWDLDYDVIPEYARLLAALGEWDAALDKFDYIEAVGGLTDFLTAEDYVTWGRALRETGDPEAAVATFETALERDPDCVPALVALGRQAADRGDHDRAVERFERALELAPEDTTAMTGLIEAHTGADRWARAREAVETAVDRHPAEGAFRLHLADVERHDGDAEAAAAAYEAALERFEDGETVRSVRREYLGLLLEGLSAEEVGGGVPDDAVRPFPAERFRRALEQVRPLYDHDRAALVGAADPEEALVERFARTATQRVAAEARATGSGAARERVLDALAALPRDRPERGDLVWVYVDRLVDDQAMVWGRQSCAYRLVIAREYEAAARLLAPLWEAREGFDPDHRFWPNLCNCLALYAGCVAGGFAAGDGRRIAEWVRGTDLSGTPAALVVEYLLDGTVTDSPGALYYGADTDPRAVDRVPTAEQLQEQSLTELEMLATATVVGELASQGEVPFDAATAEALDRRPAPEENPWLGSVDGVGPKLEFRLRQAGVRTVADLRRLDAEALQAVDGVGPSTAETIRDALAADEE